MKNKIKKKFGEGYIGLPITIVGICYLFRDYISTDVKTDIKIIFGLIVICYYIYYFVWGIKKKIEQNAEDSLPSTLATEFTDDDIIGFADSYFTKSIQLREFESFDKKEFLAEYKRDNQLRNGNK